jgi:hypothetical protein
MDVPKSCNDFVIIGGVTVQSVEWLRYRLDGLRFESRKKQNIFLFSETSTQALRPTKSPVQGILESFSEVKRPRRDAERSHSSSAEVEKGWSCISTPSLCPQGLDRDSFVKIWLCDEQNSKASRGEIRNHSLEMVSVLCNLGFWHCVAQKTGTSVLGESIASIFQGTMQGSFIYNEHHTSKSKNRRCICLVQCWPQGWSTAETHVKRARVNFGDLDTTKGAQKQQNKWR